ncbi:MAG: type VI secretion system tube protein Hcp [Rubinisphaera brasiliensis]|uniref:type VI secretion system tube protein Hcp n=1 Tax=Rubinisphaera brasiliensis TaxID=119 RepID=UPI0039190349
MNNQIYLVLKRTGEFDANVLGNVAKAAKDLILGDSMDVPFVKWINVTGVNNSIGFSSGKIRSIVNTAAANAAPTYELQTKSYGTSAGDYAASMPGDVRYAVEDSVEVEDQGIQNFRNRRRQRVQYGVRDQSTSQVSYSRFRGKITRTSRQQQVDRLQDGNWADFGDAVNSTTYQHSSKPFFTPDFDNAKLKINLPEHNEFVFTKNVDNATPQLAFAASSQEPIGHAVFAFRRRIGVGVQGVRLPYMMVFLRECLVNNWALDGDQETVSLQYQRIHWLTYDQVTDWNYPTGMSNRYWDDKNKKGGENAKLYILMGLVMAAFAVAGSAAQALVQPYHADSDNDSASRNDKRAEIE